MKYGIITSNTVATRYVVEANSQEEAEEMFADGTYQEAYDLPHYEIDSNEEVIEVQKKCPECEKGYMSERTPEVEKLYWCDTCTATMDSDDGIIK